jgi:hypothetical protein
MTNSRSPGQKKLKMATSETICKFNQSGFCKFRSHCRKQHFMETCSNKQCNMETCIYRHPMMWRYFTNFGRCKFKDSCAYLHEISENINEKEIEKLRQEVKELQMQVNELRNILSQNSELLSQTESSTSVSKATPSCSGISMVQSNHNMNSQANFGSVIPQLDAILNSLPPATQSANTFLQCETCQETFKTENSLMTTKMLTTFVVMNAISASQHK